jgi:small subunit ribosomal protein S16
VSVKLRLRRLGRRKRPIWAVVAADSRKARDGRYIEDLGRYYPLEQPARVKLDEGRVMYWLEEGAQPSDTVRSMLSKRGLMLALDLRRQGKGVEEIEEAVSTHREKYGEGAGEEASLTAEARRQEALQAERERVSELEAEEEERRKEEEERKRREAEAKKKKEAEEAAAKKAAEEEEAATEAAASDDEDEADADEADADEAEDSAADADEEEQSAGEDDDSDDDSEDDDSEDDDSEGDDSEDDDSDDDDSDDDDGDDDDGEDDDKES